jgi:cbb3-type cytochrome oxidase cytochrome c subunit
METSLVIINKESIISKLDTNYDKVKEELMEGLKKYTGLVYTDDNISEAKKDMASLNKIKDEIEKQRKDIKKLISYPYDMFELQVKELVAIIENTRGEIKKQSDVFEDQKKEEKKQLINEYYKSTNGIKQNYLFKTNRNTKRIRNV